MRLEVWAPKFGSLPCICCLGWLQSMGSGSYGYMVSNGYTTLARGRDGSTIQDSIPVTLIYILLYTQIMYVRGSKYTHQTIVKGRSAVFILKHQARADNLDRDSRNFNSPYKSWCKGSKDCRADSGWASLMQA